IYTFAPLATQANVYLATLSDSSRERARIVPSVLDSPITSPLDVVFSVEKSFGAWILEQLIIPGFEVNTHMVAPPSCIIEGHINGGIALARKEEHKLPVVSWWPATAASMIAHFGNPEHGHGGRLLDNVAAALEKQQPSTEKSIGEIFRQEPIAAEACATASTKSTRPFCVGPGVDLPSALPAEPDSTIDFLGKAYSDLGPKSVIYVAFGTMFFPLAQSARHLEIIPEEIVAHGFRLLVFALSSPQAQLGDEFKEKMTKDENAIFPGFANQLKVLEHPVAAQHDCGFELVQIRTGTAKTKAYPNTPVVGSDEAVRDEMKNMLEMSKGARGMQQSTNVKALGKVMRKSIGKGGSGDTALGEFGKAIGL
ncbi:hypothetical protein FRC10_005572, partial [Ceratobasidium sp. 414]